MRTERTRAAHLARKGSWNERYIVDTETSVTLYYIVLWICESLHKADEDPVRSASG